MQLEIGPVLSLRQLQTWLTWKQLHGVRFIKQPSLLFDEVV
jgi:hypothetical protein